MEQVKQVVAKVYEAGKNTDACIYTKTKGRERRRSNQEEAVNLRAGDRFPGPSQHVPSDFQLPN